MRDNERRGSIKSSEAKPTPEPQIVVEPKKHIEEEKIVIRDLSNTELNPKPIAQKKAKYKKFSTEPKYECEICKRKFYNPSALKSHKLFRHSAK